MRLDNFVITPRKISSDVKEGKLTGNEFLLYSWLRINLNPYGVVSVSLKAVKDDILPTVSVNYINKLLLSLLRKKYVYYQDRQGRRGSFEVHMGDLPLPNKSIKTLDKFFDYAHVISETIEEPQVKVEVSPNLTSTSQNSKVDLDSIFDEVFVSKPVQQVRGSYNDNENNNENNKLSLDKKSFKRTPVEEFKPNSTEMLRCYEIAQELGEKDMNFILGIFNKHGMGLIERAWGLYKEQIETTKIDKPGAYFNGIIQELLNE